MKKSFFLFAAIFACTLSTFAYDFEVDGIYYNYLGGDSVEVTYQGSYSSEYDGYFGAVTIPSSVSYEGTTYRVTMVGDYAFSDCENLTAITIPNSVITIGNCAFTSCPTVKTITVESGNVTYHSTDNCLIETATKTLHTGCKNSIIPTDGSVTTIGDYAFSGCYGLTTITIPDSVITIGECAFSSCSNLTTITIPNNVTTIAGRAFYGCSSISKITIPNSVTTIADMVFANCESVESLTIASGNPIYHSTDNCIIETAKKILHTGCKSSIIPTDGSVTAISDFAFVGCSNLTDITIPDSVSIIGRETFRECFSLRYENYNNAKYLGNSGNPYHALISTINTDIESCTIHENTKVIAGGAFFGCGYLTDITIGNHVTTIGNNAFNGCEYLTEVTIPNSVTFIDYAAFAYCSNLLSITIPNNITTIPSAAFLHCESLTKITIPSSVTTIDMIAFAYCSNLKEIICEAVTPPTAYYSAFEEVDKTIPLYVPTESIEAYKTAEYWNEFMNIQGISSDVTAIENPSLGVSDSNSDCKVLENGTIYILRNGEKYTIDGRKVE